jgi:phosphate/sulfate permease
MKKIKDYIYNLLPSGLVGVVIAIFEHLFLNPNSNLLNSILIYFVFGALIGTVSALAFSWTIYKTSSTRLAYLAVLFGDGLSVFLLLMLLGTHHAYGWNAVLNIILITEVLAFFIAYFSNRKYKNLNQNLESKKESLKGRDQTEKNI